MQHLLYISEQHQRKPLGVSKDVKSVSVKEMYKKAFHYKPDSFCFQLHNEAESVTVDSSYFVGVDWIVQEKAAIYVEPKLNDGPQQIDFLGMLLQSLDAHENLEHLDGLYIAEYDEPWIDIPEQKDLLSPILIIQFLKLVQKITRKGLKKSYYRVTENLNSRIKGKVLVDQQIKKNIVKNRFNKTICNYQEHGINSSENQFLKRVLSFVSSWLNQKTHFFSKTQQIQLLNILSYCSPAFEHVDNGKLKRQDLNLGKNIFYQEYEEAIKIGDYILKRFSFNISKTSKFHGSTPPFWIDMSKLFELYVFQKLKNIFPEDDKVTYHDTFYGKETDILLKPNGYQCVIDCKYKPQYQNGTPSLEDKRQLAGYVRLKSVYRKLGISQNEIVKGLIIYSHQEAPAAINQLELFEKEIPEYIEFYKLAVSLPTIVNR